VVEVVLVVDLVVEVVQVDIELQRHPFPVHKQ
jgi:hypothetical protein